MQLWDIEHEGPAPCSSSNFAASHAATTRQVPRRALLPCANVNSMLFHAHPETHESVSKSVLDE